MATSVDLRYGVDVTGGADEFSPDRIIGQLDTDTRQLVRNGTWLWSRFNRRRLLTWTAGPQINTATDTNGGEAVASVAYLSSFNALANMSEGRERVEFWTDGANADIRLRIFQRDLSTLIGTITNIHAGVRSTVATTFVSATLLTNPDIYLLVDSRLNGVAGTIFSLRAMELHILSADL